MDSDRVVLEDSSSARTFFGFINKELTDAKLTTKLLSELLVNEENRKVLLESRAFELTQVTKVNIKERTEEISSTIKSLMNRTTDIRTQLGKVVREKLPNRCDDASAYLKLDKIAQLDKSRDYVLVIYFIIFASNKVNSFLRDGNKTEAIAIFNQIRYLRNSCSNSDCANLWKYCSEVVDTWEKELQERFAVDLVNLLEKVGWPQRVEIANPSSDTIKKLQSTIRCIARLTLGNLKPPDITRPSILIDYKQNSPLVEIMMRPLRKRFRYHFCSSKPTNDDTKPEWYFTQVKHWIRDLVSFLETHVEGIVISECHTSAILDFVQALSEILILKTDVLLSTSTGRVDDSVFSKILEESIRYELEVKTLFEELSLKDKDKIPPFVNTLFSQPMVLTRWLSIEKRGSLDKLDILFASPTAWNRVVVPGPTEISELFVMMLRFITDRFSHLRQPGQKIQFVELLIEILDDFRIRCIQVWNSSNSDKDHVLKGVLVGETLGYVQSILESWESLPFFVNLDYFWGKIRQVEKEDLEFRRIRKFSGISKEDKVLEKLLFSDVQERYTSSIESVLVSMSQE